jgi:acetylornithine deacetylase/succinyl-diaminopimelate desuccinylase family protein
MEDTDAVVAELRELVSRPSVNPPGDERELVEYLADRFASSPVPFDVETHEVKPDRPNVVARAGDPSRGRLLLTGHVDVVPATAENWTGDPFELREEDGRLYGRGTADMKGAVAAQIQAAEAYLQAADDPGEVSLAYVVDEESTGDGTAALVERGMEADAAILGEPTDLGLGVAHFGSVRYTVHVHGRRSHAARPSEGRNAIEGIRRVLNAVRDLDATETADDHPFLDAESIKPTVLDSDDGGNVIPAAASVIVDWRFHPGPTDESAFRERLQTAFDEALAGTDLTADLELWQFTRGAEVDADAPVATAVEQAAADRGYDCAPFGCNYGADTPHLIYGGGIPTVLFGPGNIDDAHSIDESIRTADLVAATEIYERAIERFFDAR